MTDQNTGIKKQAEAQRKKENKRGVHSIKDSFSKVRHIPMVMDENGRATLDYSKLAKKKLTVNDMMHLKLMQDYLKNGGPEEYKMYLDTVKAYYPPQKIKEVIIEKLAAPPVQAVLSNEQVQQIIGEGNFNPKNYSDEELEAIINQIEEAPCESRSIERPEADVRGVEGA